MMNHQDDAESMIYYHSENSHNDDSLHSDCTGEHHIPTKEEEQVIADKESKAVLRSKLVVLLVLAFSAIGVALAVYFYITKSEETQFEGQFYDDANKVLEGIASSLDKSLGAFDSLAVTIVSLARATNQTFPYITVPDYGVHVSKILPLIGAISASLLAIVTPEQRGEWEWYASPDNTNIAWVNESMRLQDTWDYYYGPMPQNFGWEGNDVIHGDFGNIPYNDSRTDRLPILLPQWQSFPAIPVYPPANWDWYSVEFPEALTSVLTNRKAVISEPYMIPRPDNPDAMVEMEAWCKLNTDFLPPEENCMEPVSDLFYPVIDNLDRIKIAGAMDYPDGYEVKAILAAPVYWRNLIKDILPPGSRGIVLVFRNPCSADDFTYQIDGPTVKYLGVGDFHDSNYDSISIHGAMFDLNSYRVGESRYSGLPADRAFCPFTIHVYPSDDMKNEYKTNNSIIFAISAIAIFIFTSVVFLVYDRMVARRQKLVMTTATRSSAIVSSLFPSAVRDRLYPMVEDDKIMSKSNKKVLGNPFSARNQLQTFVRDGKEQADAFSNSDAHSKLAGAPIAELYPDTTVLFADIAGFTAWCSGRQPAEVFILLETLYGAFDRLALRRGVFKVETIGDCYVAVVGLPEPRADHAVAMARFSKDILSKMTSLTSQLEKTLGPGTSNLALRIGLNSGPTTAGVLRGEKGRFQLFGDTVNTAARMESNSARGRIMCSEKTADLLVAAGKGHWVTPREDLVEAKGKGKMQCYWCHPKSSGSGSVVSGISECTMSDNNEGTTHENEAMAAESLQRLVDWNIELFEGLLKDVVSHRISTRGGDQATTERFLKQFGAPRDEVSRTIVLPRMTSKQKANATPKDVQLSSSVRSQLREYISGIAMLYRANPFHNFEHASHVTMATKKLLCRVAEEPDETTTSGVAYGITSDPLTQFAIVFSALIHDVDHPGVPNTQLIKERAAIAVMYENKSVAEQNSVALAWELLIQPKFAYLRNAIMPTESECERFRQLLVNAVMATDLFDPDLKSLRDNRWQKAFDGQLVPDMSKAAAADEDSNRRATIVIEHIIQASDVSHTMQHWHIYQKWNILLLEEMHASYVQGRAEKDPTIGWYEGELWFFDNYIIPLAKRLKTCSVFGVSCDEFLSYATENRAEWAAKGRDIVAAAKEALNTGRECAPF